MTADRDYFDAVVAANGPDAATLEFPGYCPERRFRLSGAEMRIGRRSVSRGLQPEIDLTGPPADTGVSHLHAVLLAQPDGSWAIVDPGSANGTKLNEQDLSIGVRTASPRWRPDLPGRLDQAHHPVRVGAPARRLAAANRSRLTCAFQRPPRCRRGLTECNGVARAGPITRVIT